MLQKPALCSGTSWVLADARLEGQVKGLSSSGLSSPSPCASLSTTTTTEGSFIMLMTKNKNLISAWALHALQQTGSLSESEPAPNFCTLKAVVWLRFSCAPVFKVHSESSNHKWEAWNTTRKSKNTLLTHLRWANSDHSLSWPVLCVTTLVVPPGPQWFRALVQV